MYSVKKCYFHLIGKYSHTGPGKLLGGIRNFNPLKLYIKENLLPPVATHTTKLKIVKGSDQNIFHEETGTLSN